MTEIGIESTLVEEIKKGRKSIEARLGKPKFLKLREGDLLSVREDLWYDGKIIDSFAESITLKITQILYFESFSEMFEATDFKAAIPSAETMQDAIVVYRKFYSPQVEDELGVVALFFDIFE